MNSEQRKEYFRKYYQNNKDHLSKYFRNWNSKNPNYFIRWRKDKYWKNRESERSEHRSREKMLKDELIKAYGGYCVCCGEDNTNFITLDHINRDGNIHRKLVKNQVYRDLKKRGWPKESYRLLCMNCNWATRFGDSCPHQTDLVSLITSGLPSNEKALPTPKVSSVVK